MATKDRWIVCGVHGCENMALVRDDADATAQGWFFDSIDGYGWICASHAVVDSPAPSEHRRDGE